MDPPAFELVDLHKRLDADVWEDPRRAEALVGVLPDGLVPLVQVAFGVGEEIRAWFLARFLPDALQIPGAVVFVALGLLGRLVGARARASHRLTARETAGQGLEPQLPEPESGVLPITPPGNGSALQYRTHLADRPVRCPSAPVFSALHCRTAQWGCPLPFDDEGTARNA